jgi:hypothetical protein
MEIVSLKFNDVVVSTKVKTPKGYSRKMEYIPVEEDGKGFETAFH